MDTNIRPEIRLSATGRCNYDCVYCCEEGKESTGYGEITIEQIEYLGELIHSLGLPHVHITGGEPTLKKDLEQIILTLKRSGIQNVALTTNGSRLDDDYLDRLVQAGLDGLHVHFPSFNKEVYKKTTGQSIDPRNIAEMVIKASKKVRTRFNVPVTSINYNYINEILNYAYNNMVSVSLIEITNLNKNLKIKDSQIRKLLLNWARSKGYTPTLEQESEKNESGELYHIGAMGRVRIIPSQSNCVLTMQNPQHNCTIKDNRVWIGGFNGKYLYTDCRYKPLTELSLDELKEKLKAKYTLTSLPS